MSWMTSKALQIVDTQTALKNCMNGGEEEEHGLFLLSAFQLDVPSHKKEHDVNIGPLSLHGGVYTHKGAGYSIRVQDQSEKVTS
jgi:hypothetical protein